MCRTWECELCYLDRLIVDVETERYSLMEGSHWFACAVNIDCVLRLNVALLVVYSGFDDAITNCLKTITSAWKRATETLQGMAAHTDACTYLCNYELGIFRTVKKQLFGYVRQRNARVGQADHAHASLYHIVTQSKSGSIIRIIHLKNTKILHCSFSCQPDDKRVGAVFFKS